MMIPRYYEDLTILHKNTMPNRAYYIPASGRQSDLVEKRERSDRFQLLSGQWKFRYFDSIYDAQEAFYAEDYDTDGFQTVTVPDVWQNYGADQHQYTNIRYPFPMDPPYVPHANPCGEYVRTFIYHKDGKAPKAFLNFEGVDSCFYVWLNGGFVGYSQVSHSTSEFDVTDFLKEGENRLAVLVLKWCDGSYMEDQDKFRMSGIFRDVYLLKRPMDGIFDYFVKTTPSDDYSSAKVEVSLRYQSCPVDTTVTLYDGEGAVVAQRVVRAAENRSGEQTEEQPDTQPIMTAVLAVQEAHLWNAEEPYLYELVLETEGEVITDYVGIREVHAKKGVLYVNGSKVKLHGTNRHDSDPVTGFTISLAQIRKDLALMKEHNINAIRTSHYPNVPWFYHLYDRFGFFVIDEADNESHGAGEIYIPPEGEKDRPKHWNEPIADNPDFTDAVVDRVQRLVERDKNRPCVIMWSMGNECAYGCTFEAALAWTKEFDATRLTHYESARYTSDKRKYDYSKLDTYSRMYPSIQEIHDYFKEDGTKPFVLCEYCHAMGNGPGDLEAYFQVVHQYEGACGGFIWEWCDHAIDMGKTAAGKTIYAYGGDNGEYPHDGNFCMDGLVYPNRRPHTGLLEFKNVHRPARVIALDLKKKEVILHNYMDFLNLRDYLTLQYELSCDGRVTEKGCIEDAALLDIPPHEEKAVPLCFAVPEKGKAFLKLTYLLKKETEMLPAGFVLGFEEVKVETADNRNQKVRKILSDSLETHTEDRAAAAGDAGKHAEKEKNTENYEIIEENAENPANTACREARHLLDVYEDDTTVIIAAPQFRYTYDKLTGVFSEMIYQNHVLLARPMEFNIWRAPTDNDREISIEWKKAQYDRTVTRAYETKVSGGQKEVRIETVLSISAVFIQRILDIRACWIIRQDGAVDMTLEAEKNTVFPFLPRFGIRLFLPKAMSRVRYCGIGPYESYEDKHWAGFHGVFCADVTAMHEDYIRPQENGSHFDCDYVTVCEPGAGRTAADRPAAEDGRPENEPAAGKTAVGSPAALTVAGARSFSFNASVYTQEELAQKAHNYELEESPYTVLCVDYRQSGIGSASCGPELAQQYRLNENRFSFAVRLVPDIL